MTSVASESQTLDDASVADTGFPKGVWWIAASVTALLLVVSPRYGWHRDELYFLQAGRHLDWGYIDQPPFTPFVARVADEVARHNLFALRLAPALATAATVVIGAAFVREVGGSRRAQVEAAGAVAGGGFVLGAGHLLSTATFDLTAWMGLLWVAARLLRTGDPRWWVAFGGVAGVALWNKHLVVLLAAAVLAGLLLDRRWRLLLSSWLLGGGALALLIASPNLAWQAANGWPQLDMAEALSERLAAENRVTLLPLQLLFVGPLLVPLLWWGVGWLHRNASGRRFRPLLWSWPVGLALTFATGGRPYYAFPLTVTIALCGVVAHDRRRGGARGLHRLLIANAVLTVPLALPVLPVSMARAAIVANESVAETIGWPELVAQVANVVDGLPPGEEDDVVLLTGSYGEAGALDRHGPEHGLPPAFSAHNSYADFRQPDNDHATVVAVRYRLDVLERHFERCQPVAMVDSPHDIPNEVNGTPIHVCRGLRGTWADIWPQLRHLS